MKFDESNRIILALSVMLLLAVAALSVLVYNSGVLAGDPSISEEEAKQIAEDHFADYNGKAIRVDMEKEGMLIVYEVIVDTDNGRFEVEVDADNGDILEVEEDDGDEDEGDDDDGEEEDEGTKSSDETEDPDDDENEHEFEGEEEGDN